MGHDFFISYVFAKPDREHANKLVRAIESGGGKCWIAERDRQHGKDFPSELTNAIREAKAMVVVLSGASNSSVYVADEVALARDEKKIIFVVRVEEVLPSELLRIYLGRLNWVDTWNTPIKKIAEDFVRIVRDTPATDSVEDAPALKPGPSNNKNTQSKILALISVAGASVLILSGVLWFSKGGGDEDDGEKTEANRTITQESKEQPENVTPSVDKAGESTASSEVLSSQERGPPVTEETPLRVSREGGTDFRTLSDALTAAKSGQIIAVFPGEYAESFKVAKDVTVRGMGRVPTDVIFHPKNGICAEIQANSVKFENIAFRANGDEAHCIVVRDGIATFDNIDVRNAGLSGIAVDGKSKIAVSQSSITNSQEAAIRLRDQSEGTIRNSELAFNTKAGIAVLGESAAKVYETRIIENALDGIFISSSSPSTLINNKILGNTGYGVLVLNALDLTLESNSILYNGAGGIKIDGGSSVTIQENQITENGGVGVEVAKLTDLNLVENSIMRNGAYGLVVGDKSTVTVKNGEIAENGAGQKLVDNTSKILNVK